MSDTSPPIERLTVSVADTAAMLGVPKPTIYSLIRRGELPAIRVGVRLLLLKSVVDDWINTGRLAARPAIDLDAAGANPEPW
jgi:excisionase family DNA binding protein